MRARSLARLVTFFSFAAVAALAASFPRSARADDDESAAYSSFDIAFDSGAKLPEGWKLVERAAAAADEEPVQKSIQAVGADKGVGTADMTFVSRTAATADGKKVVFVLIDLDTKNDAFSKALKDAGAAKGWTAREMGHPTRLLVVSGPEDLRGKGDAAMAVQAANVLVSKAEGSRNPRAMLRLADAALAIDGKSARAHRVAGIVHGEVGSRDQDKAELDKAIAHFHAALGKDATGGLSPADKATAQRSLGSALLDKGGPSEEARDVLKEALAAKGSVEKAEAFGWQYDLACAHARLKEIEEAFKQLTPVLEENDKNPIQGISHWRKDPDFENLKSDPRWDAFLKKYPDTGGGTHGGGDGGN